MSDKCTLVRRSENGTGTIELRHFRRNDVNTGTQRTIAHFRSGIGFSCRILALGANQLWRYEGSSGLRSNEYHDNASLEHCPRPSYAGS